MKHYFALYKEDDIRDAVEYDYERAADAVKEFNKNPEVEDVLVKIIDTLFRGLFKEDRAGDLNEVKEDTAAWLIKNWDTLSQRTVGFRYRFHYAGEAWILEYNYF